ncbi:MAG: nuclear transport factor 2 family protein [Bacteroidetes bacterium]|nr:nuclear transport factor 2 family protein [Bacteroidota bacterium]MBS1670767.1 nuclear transport factor 2 family protein [Bacteroidota bacterium]
MKKTTTLLLTLFVFVFANAQNTDEQQIASVLNTQKNEWNKGNIEKFMIGYWESDSLVFMSKNGPIYGYKNALNNYKKNYSDTVAMGKLRFEIVSIKKLSNNYAFVIGKYFLTRSIGNANGAFTLLFKKINGAWNIVVDHSS